MYHLFVVRHEGARNEGRIFSFARLFILGRAAPRGLSPPLKVIRHISSFLVSTQIREGPSMNDAGEILKLLVFLKVLKYRIYQTSLTYKFAFRSNSVHLSYVKVPQGRTRHDNTDRRHEERRSEISTRTFQCPEFVTHIFT